jgi:hypothetical protein
VLIERFAVNVEEFTGVQGQEDATELLEGLGLCALAAGGSGECTWHLDSQYTGYTGMTTNVHLNVDGQLLCGN